MRSYSLCTWCRTKAVVTACVALSSTTVYSDDYYIVRKGEIFSRIGRQIFGAPTYSENGAYNKLRALNPDVVDPNGLVAGQKLRISISEPASLSAVQAPIERRPASEPEVLPLLPSIPTSANRVRSSFFIGANGDFSVLAAVDRATGGKATLVSGLSPGFSLGWDFHSSDSSTIRISGNASRYSFEKLKVGNTLNNSTGTVMGIALGWSTDLGSRLTIGFGVHSQEELFAYGESKTVFTVDKAAILEPEVNFRMKLLNRSNGNAGVMGTYKVPLASATDSYSIQSGSSILGGVFIRQDFDKKATDAPSDSSRGLEGQATYSQITQNASVTTQSHAELGLTLLYFLNFD